MKNVSYWHIIYNITPISDGRPSKPWSQGTTSGSSSKWAKQRVLTSTQLEAVRIGDVALGLMDEMDEAGVGPDVITYG